MSKEELNFWEGLEKYSTSEVSSFMEKDFKERLSLFIGKDQAYGGSWQQDGLNGAFLNLKRKWDRAAYIFKTGQLFNQSEETIVDTLQDLQNYAAMFQWLYLKKLDLLKEPIPVAVAHIESKAKIPSPGGTGYGKKFPYAVDSKFVNEEEDDDLI